MAATIIPKRVIYFKTDNRQKRIVHDISAAPRAKFFNNLKRIN